MPQWLAVRKNGVLSRAVLFTITPEQKMLPPVEMAALELISARQSSPSGQTTSTLQLPERSSISSSIWPNVL
jgi:hypothetical protein